MAKAKTSSNWADILDAMVAKGLFGKVIRRILLYGPPSTGKTSWAEYRKLHERIVRQPLTQDLLPTDILGGFRLDAKDGGTRTVWCDGPIMPAVRLGGVVQFDEGDQAGPEMRTMLHGLMDDLSIAVLTLGSGEVVKPHKDTVFIMTTNANPMELDEALRDRFDLILPCLVPSSGVLATFPEGMQKALTSHFENEAREKEGTWKYTSPMSVRTMGRVRDLEASGVSREEAVRLVFNDPSIARAVIGAIAS